MCMNRGEIVLNASNWKELKHQLKQMTGKAIFKLERVNSMNDGMFYRVLHKVSPHELVFFDGKQLTYLQVNPSTEKEIEYFEGGFRFGNCTYTLDRMM